MAGDPRFRLLLVATICLHACCASLHQANTVGLLGDTSRGASVVHEQSSSLFVASGSAIHRFALQNTTGMFSATPTKTVSLSEVTRVSHILVDPDNQHLLVVASTPAHDKLFKLNLTSMSVEAAMHLNTPHGSTTFKAAALSPSGQGLGVFQTTEAVVSREMMDGVTERTLFVLETIMLDMPGGQITAWELYASQVGKIELQVLREVWPGSHEYEVVSSVATTVEKLGFKKIFLGSSEAPAMSFKTGDKLGLLLTPNEACVNFDIQNGSTVAWIGGIPEGNIIGKRFVMHKQQARVYSIRVHGSSFSPLGHELLERNQGNDVGVLGKSVGEGSTQFDGQGGYILVEKDEIIGTGGHGLTVEGWVRVPEALWASNASLFDQKESFAVLWFGGELKFNASIAGISETIASYQVSKELAGHFFHLACTVQNSTAFIAVNGKIVADASSKAPFSFTGVSNNLIIGSNAATDDLFFLGHMAEIRVWQDGRTIEEINAFKDRVLVGGENSLAVYLPLDGFESSVGTPKKSILRPDSSEPTFDPHVFAPIGWTLVAFAKDGAFNKFTEGQGEPTANRAGVFVDKDFLYRLRNSTKIAISWNKEGIPSGGIGAFDNAVSFTLPSPLTMTMTGEPVPQAGDGAEHFSTVSSSRQVRMVDIDHVCGSFSLPARMYMRATTFGANSGHACGLVGDDGASKSLDWAPDDRKFAAVYLGLGTEKGFVTEGGKEAGYVPSTMAIWVNEKTKAPALTASGAGKTWIDLGLHVNDTEGGSIAAWEINAHALGPLKLQVWRQGDEGKFQLVGETAVDVKTPGEQTVELGLNQTIAVQHGDYIGWSSPGDGILSFDEFNTWNMFSKSQAGSDLATTPKGLVWRDFDPLSPPQVGATRSFSGQDKPATRTYSVKAHIVPSHSPVLVLGSYSSPSTVATVSLERMALIRSAQLKDATSSFLTSALVDDETSTVLFTADTSPGRVIRISLATLTEIQALAVNDTFATQAMVLNKATGKLFVASATHLLQVGLRRLLLEDSIPLHGLGIKSLTLDESTGVIFAGTTKGQIVRFHQGKAELRLPCGQFGEPQIVRFQNSTVMEVRAVHSYTTKSPLLFAISAGPKLHTTVLATFRRDTAPTFVSVSPSCGHISGGTRLTITGETLDESVRVVLSAPAGSAISMLPSQSQIEAGLAEGMVRIVDGSGKPSLQGRAEILHDGEWGSFCGDSTFDDREARLVCMAAGYTGGNVLRDTCTKLNICGLDDAPIWVSQLTCDGWEQNMQQCTKAPFDQLVQGCSHSADVLVACTMTADGTVSLPVIHMAEAGPSGDQQIVAISMESSAVGSQNMSLINIATYPSLPFSFKYYDAKVNDVSPRNMPAFGSTALTIVGGGFVHDELATIRFVRGATNTTAPQVIDGVSVSLVGSVLPGEIKVHVQTSETVIPGEVYLEVSLDRQHWMRCPVVFTFTDVAPASISPAVGPKDGGTKVTIVGSGFLQSDELKIGLFATKYDKSPIEIIDSDDGVTMTKDAKSINFVTPPVALVTAGEPARLYFGVSIDGQNFDIVPNEFLFYDAAVSRLDPPLSVLTGGGFITIVGTGFVETKETKVKIGEAASAITVGARFVDSHRLLFKAPQTTRAQLLPVQLSFNGQQFQTTDVKLEYFDASFTAIEPALFVSGTPSTLAIKGSGFPTSGKELCQVTLLVEEKELSFSVPAFVNTSSLITIPATPDTGDFTGNLSVRISFDGGVRFADTGLTVATYELQVTNVRPSTVVQSQNTLVSVFGKGFFKSSAITIEFQNVDDLTQTKTVAVEFVDAVELRFKIPEQLGAGTYSLSISMGKDQPKIQVPRQIIVRGVAEDSAPLLVANV